MGSGKSKESNDQIFEPPTDEVITFQDKPIEGDGFNRLEVSRIHEMAVDCVMEVKAEVEPDPPAEVLRKYRKKLERIQVAIDRIKPTSSGVLREIEAIIAE